MTQNIDVMRQLMARWKERDFDGFLNLLSDDFEYHWHVGTKPLHGKEKMRKFLNNYSTSFEQRVWDIRHYAEAGDLLMIEGYEELYDKTHDRVIQQPFMQACEFKSGKLAKMRDYYEPANLRPPAQAAAKSA
jgi:ketosteroid isomerase-like protein